MVTFQKVTEEKGKKLNGVKQRAKAVRSKMVQGRSERLHMTKEKQDVTGKSELVEERLAEVLAGRTERLRQNS